MLLKADNEPAIQALVDGVRATRGERTTVEKSPKYPHQSNGAAENAASRFIKRDDARSACSWLRGKECDSPMAPIGETVDFKVVRGDMAELEPRSAVGIFLGRTDESDEAIVGNSCRDRVCTAVSATHEGQTVGA